MYQLLRDKNGFIDCLFFVLVNTDSSRYFLNTLRILQHLIV